MSPAEGIARLGGIGHRAVVAPVELWHGSTGSGLTAGLRGVGWNVTEVDTYDYFIMSRLRLARLAARALQPLSVASYNQAILQAARQAACEIMITCKGTAIRRDTLVELGRAGVLRTNFYPDVHFEHGGVGEALLQHYDLVVTTKPYHVDHLSRLLGPDRVAYVPHGYSPAVHRQRQPDMAEADYRWDIAYVGIASASKRDWLIEVARRFPDRRLVVVGPGWAPLARGTILEPFLLGHALHGDYYARLVEQSRITLAFHFGASGAQGWEDSVSTRTFEIPACGGFMLHIDNPEVRTLYDVPSEIDTFADAAELGDKIAYYLDRPALRRAMIARAHRRCVPAYGLSQRAVQIAAAIEARL